MNIALFKLLKSFLQASECKKQFSFQNLMPKMTVLLLWVSQDVPVRLLRDPPNEVTCQNSMMWITSKRLSPVCILVSSSYAGQHCRITLFALDACQINYGKIDFIFVVCDMSDNNQTCSTTPVSKLRSRKILLMQEPTN